MKDKPLDQLIQIVSLYNFYKSKVYSETLPGCKPTKWQKTMDRRNHGAAINAIGEIFRRCGAGEPTDNDIKEALIEY